MTSRLRKNGDRRPTPSPDPREAVRSGAEGLPLLPRGLASQALVQGERRVVLGGRGGGRRQFLTSPLAGLGIAQGRGGLRGGIEGAGGPCPNRREPRRPIGSSI